MTDQPAAAVTVAIDAGPLLGAMTGIGMAVDQLVGQLDRRSDVDLVPYACSFRGRLRPGMTRLPLPAALAVRLWSRAEWPRVDRWLAGAQVVHGTNYVVPPSRLPRVVTVYDCWFLRDGSKATAAVQRAGNVLRRAVREGATVHASSHATADTIREILHTDRVEVIHLAALPPETVRAGSQSPVAELAGVPFVLAVGTLERRKNLSGLVSAFDELAHRHADLRLVLAGGDGDDRVAIDEAIDALHPHARGRVVLTGRIEPAGKAWLLAHAAVLAYPSLDEGFGFPLLEAMQHDVPVVASRVGSIPEVAGDAALLVPHDDVAALADAVDRALTDSPTRIRLTAAGRERLNHFSWADTAAKMTDLYRRVAAGGGAV